MGTARTRHFALTILMASALASAAFFAFLGGAPYVASEVYQLSSFWAGVCFGAPAVGYATGNFISGRYSVRVGINRMIMTGAIIGAAGLTTATVLIASGYDTGVSFGSLAHHLARWRCRALRFRIRGLRVSGTS